MPNVLAAWDSTAHGRGTQATRLSLETPASTSGPQKLLEQRSARLRGAFAGVHPSSVLPSRLPSPWPTVWFRVVLLAHVISTLLLPPLQSTLPPYLAQECAALHRSWWQSRKPVDGMPLLHHSYSLPTFLHTVGQNKRSPSVVPARTRQFSRFLCPSLCRQAV